MVVYFLKGNKTNANKDVTRKYHSTHSQTGDNETGNDYPSRVAPEEMP